MRIVKEGVNPIEVDTEEFTEVFLKSDTIEVDIDEMVKELTQRIHSEPLIEVDDYYHKMKDIIKEYLQETLNGRLLLP